LRSLNVAMAVAMALGEALRQSGQDLAGQDLAGQNLNDPGAGESHA
jgi:hypothetical protein